MSESWKEGDLIRVGTSEDEDWLDDALSSLLVPTVSKFNPNHDPENGQFTESPAMARDAAQRAAREAREAAQTGNYGAVDRADFPGGMNLSGGTQDVLESKLSFALGGNTTLYIPRTRSTVFSDDPLTDGVIALPSQADRNVARAARETVEVLKEFQSMGVTIPTGLMFRESAEVGGQAAGSSLSLRVPRGLPDELSLDDAVQASGMEAVPTTWADVVTHELAHTLHNVMEKQDAPAVASQVSKYATTNAWEFVAEVFTAHHAGRTLSPAVLAAYASLQGPPLGERRSSRRR